MQGTSKPRPKSLVAPKTAPVHTSTGVLDDAQLRTIEERLRYPRELDERRARDPRQGKLDSALKQAINAADSKARLEDLYLPYRPKRRTKAQLWFPTDKDSPPTRSGHSARVLPRPGARRSVG